MPLAWIWKEIFSCRKKMLRVALDMLYVLIGLIARVVERIAAPLAWLLLAVMLSASIAMLAMPIFASWH